MNKVKTRKKNPSKKEMLQILPADITLLRKVAVKILKKIDKELSSPVRDGSNTYVCDRIFGQKASFTETLVLLADLLVKISPYESNDPIEEAESDSIPFSKADIALVEAFIERQAVSSHMSVDNVSR